MTDINVDELIAEARHEADLAELHPSRTAEPSILRDLASALEVAHQRAEVAEKDRRYETEQKVKLAAVVEKARAEVEGESGWFRHRAGRVLDILATAPTDALRELKGAGPMTMPIQMRAHRGEDAMNARTSIRNVALDANARLLDAIADFRAARAELSAAHENSEAARIAWAAVSRDPDDDVVRRGNELSLEAVEVLNSRIEKGS